MVKRVRAIGSPSFVYGTAELYYEDGTSEMIYTQAFKPRKCDVEIMPGK